MIVVRLFGGLGNQMFQYAAARRLALQHGTEVLLDVRWFVAQEARSPDLTRLRVRAELAPGSAQLNGVPPAWTGAGRAARLRARVVSRRHGWSLQVEGRPGVFDRRLLRAPDHSQLIGYWQSERYFADREAAIREEMVSRRPLSETAISVQAEIDAVGGVSLHVRRGDYEANPQAHRAHGVCPPEYYRDAMSFMDDRLGSPAYFLFSDDPDWAQDNIRHPRIRIVSSAASTLSVDEELHLMASCRAHIVANSSFSWWGAWLGRYPEKVVVAPRAWFADPSLASDDIVPPSWVRV